MNRSEVEEVARARGVEDVILPYELTPQMRQWVHEVVPGGTRFERRLELLSQNLLDPKSFNLEYRKSQTTTAAEVFENHRANCLSFTHMFVGMARELDVPVYFLEVRDIENYERQGDLVVISDHIAVGFGPLHDLTIIDFAAESGTQYRKIRPIHDLTAIALYYSNIGAEHLREGKLEEAIEWLQDAVAIDPDLAAGWVNLGVALRRSGDSDGAKRSYRRALEEDPQTLSAYHNLAALLRLEGQEEEAMELLALTDRNANRNPFTYLALGDLSMRHGRHDEAGRFYRRAVRLWGNSAEPYAALGLWELEVGQKSRARRWLKKARKIDPEHSRVNVLAQRIESSSSGK